MADAHKNDVGTVIRLVVERSGAPLNISTATTVKQIRLQKPSGATLTKAASFTSDGADGQMEYLSVAGDLNETGRWAYQGYLEITGWSGSTPVAYFEVANTLV